MENCFILLELPFDPPESDVEKINKAIAQKQAQWSSDLLKIARRAKASEYLSQLNEIKKIMLDPDARQREAEAAKKIRATKEKELEDKLKLYRAKYTDKGTTLSVSDLKNLVKQFGPFGFTADEIQRRFKPAKQPQNEVKPDEILDKMQAKNMRSLLGTLDMQEKTLYDFLSLPSTASCSQLREAAETMKKRLLAKGDKNGRDTAAQSLCGLCIVIFKDAASKRKYDNYVYMTRFPQVNIEIDDLAQSNQRRIEPKMKESLIDFAVGKYSITVADASDYINLYCSYMGYTLAENKIVCGLCGAENAVGTTNCVKCGKPLILICPSCGTQNNNSAKTCVKCHFDLTKMDQAVELLKQAKQKYAEKALEEASRLIKEAKVFWPNHADIAPLEKAIQQELDWRKKMVAEVSDDVKARRLYTARTKIDQARAAGFELDPAVARKVSADLQEVEAKLARLRTAAGDEAFRIVMELSKVIADSDELNQSLKKYPPETPGGLSGRRVGKSLTLSWMASPSVGEISYQVVRKENTYPNNPADGIAIYTGKELSFTDSNLAPNTVFYYSVFACRIGVYSKAARLETAVANVEPVDRLRAVGADGMVNLSWKKSSTVTEIRVWKYCGVERPQNDEDYEAVPCTRLDGLTINGLTNGSCYWFAVSAGHMLNGHTYFSEKVYISSVPQKPAKPLQDFSVELADDVFQAHWTASEWDVILFYAKSKPEYAVGTIYDLDDLLSKYEKIDINLKSSTEADFHLSFVGECYIIPGVINASNVILNRAAYISSVPKVKDITFDMNAAGTEMYVNFTWPRKVEHSLMLYRMDDYPAGLDDPQAHRIECSKRQYQSNEGILLSNPPQGTFYTEIYTYFETANGRVYSDGCRAMLSNEPQKEAYYSIKYKKPSFFNKKSTLTVEVKVDGGGLFPAFVIVSKFKSAPLKRSDGDVVCMVNDFTKISNSYLYEFEVPPLRPETRLKLFFLNDKYYKAFKIVCTAGNTI